MVVCCRLKSSEHNATRSQGIGLHVARLGETPIDVCTVQVTQRHSPDCRGTGSTCQDGPAGSADIHSRQNADCKDLNELTGSTGLRLSGSGDCSVETGGMCRRHYLFLQQYFPATTIVIAMKLIRNPKGSPTAPSTPAPWHLKTWHECLSCSHKIPVGLGDMKQSACNGTLMVGLVHKKILYVWEAREKLKKLQLVSKAELVPQTHCKSVLVALGRHLSIIAQRPKDGLCIPLGSEMAIVQTGSGRALHRISATIPSNCWYLLSREAWRWLSDVGATSPSLLLTAMYSDDSTRRLAFALVRQPNQKHYQPQAHWVQAVNHTFQKNL